ACGRRAAAVCGVRAAPGPGALAPRGGVDPPPWAVGFRNPLPPQPVRVAADDAVADRAAVILVVEPEGVEAGLLEQTLDDLGEPVKGVLELVGRVGVPEAWGVGRGEGEAVGERRGGVAAVVR